MIDDLLNFEDLSGTYSVTDITLSMVLSLVLTAVIAKVYQKTHKGTSYTQSYVHTLILMGMLVSLVMLIVGSNLARAFSLVGALSIVRFRNAVKETRDVGYIFFAMAVGMATGTRFYVLACVATAVISLAMVILTRFDLYKHTATTQLLKVQVPSDMAFESSVDSLLLRYTDESSLVSVDSIRGGALTEVTYSIRPKKNIVLSGLLREARELNGGQKVSILTGYGQNDL